MFVIKEGTAPDKVGEGTTTETIASINKFLEKNGYTVRTLDQDGKFTQSKIDEAFYKRNNQLEQTIKEVTGIEPKAEEKEKYFDFLKRAVTEKLASAGSAAEEVTRLKAKVTELEKGGANASVVDEYKKQLSDAQTAAANTKKEYEDKINKLNGDIFGSKVTHHLDSALGSIKSKLKKLEFEDDVIAARMNKFNSLNRPHDFEGMIVFKDDKGVTRTSKKDGKPLTAAEIMEEEIFADLIDKDRKAGGAGSGGGGKGAGEGGKDLPAWKTIQLDKTIIKDRQLLYKSLINDHKLVENSKDFHEAMTELGKDLPIRS